MALLRVPSQDLTLTDPAAITAYLAQIGVDYEIWSPSHALSATATNEEILAAYAAEIEQLSAKGGYKTADVININAQTPNLDTMLAKFNREHWHDEDEVRFIIEGHGLFHIHPQDAPIVAIEVTAGDLIRLPRGIYHWFDLCSDRQIRTIRLFQDMAGWTPYYTESGQDREFQPLCFGLTYLPVTPVGTTI